ncbi:MAG: FAD-binding oxidoreductase [Candidatus Bathyarchaeia archaeon]
MEKMELYSNLSEIFGSENVTVTYEDLLAYEGDDNRLRKLQVYFPKYREKFLADAAVIATDREQIVKLVNFANEHKTPLIPRAGGTSLHGQLIPIKGGVIVDTTRMDRIKEINTRARYAVVEPGVLYRELNDDLEKRGYWFPCAPGSERSCRIGGMVGNNASGTRACKYGTTKDFVLGLEVVLPTGEVVRLGGKSLKSSSGINLKDLFVGSEGTLGIITEVTLRIDPKPEFEMSAVVGFRATEDACNAAMEVIGRGLIPASMELVGPAVIPALNFVLPEELKMPDRRDGVEANLIIRTDATDEPTARAEMERIVEVCKGFNALRVKEYDLEQSIHLWRMRDECTATGGRATRPPPEHFMIGGDVIGDIGVPLDRILEFVQGAEKICRKYRFMLSYVGHIGDGNLHLGFGYRRPDKRWALNEARCERELIEFAVSLGGTVSAEHGAGLWMAHLLPIEHGPALGLMRRIKRLLDPNNIMNPGKMNLDFLPEIVDPENWFREG